MLWLDRDDIVEIKERLTKIEVLLGEQVGNLNCRVSKLESNQSWLVRTLLGAIFLGLIALLGI